MLTKQPITKKMNVPAAKAWDAISKIGRLDVWFSFLDSCRVEGDGPGAHRYLTVANNGGSIHDIITEIDHARKRLVYLRPESPFPVSHYQGTVEVFKSYDGLAVVVWTIDFESKPEDSASVAKIVLEAISGGLDGMEADLSK